MSDENFINRWSRRKREAADESVQSKKTDPAQTINPPVEEPELSSRRPAGPSANAFDVSSLPSIESIGAGTDITAFLQAGVPSALRRAALRRAWEADKIQNLLRVVPKEDHFPVSADSPANNRKQVGRGRRGRKQRRGLYEGGKAGVLRIRRIRGQDRNR